MHGVSRHVSLESRQSTRERGTTPDARERDKRIGIPTPHMRQTGCAARRWRVRCRWQWHGRRGRGGFITDESTARAISMGA